MAELFLATAADHSPLPDGWSWTVAEDQEGWVTDEDVERWRDGTASEDE